MCQVTREETLPVLNLLISADLLPVASNRLRSLINVSEESEKPKGFSYK